jgi:hypothetical protein
MPGDGYWGGPVGFCQESSSEWNARKDTLHFVRNEDENRRNEAPCGIGAGVRLCVGDNDIVICYSI